LQVGTPAIAMRWTGGRIVLGCRPLSRVSLPLTGEIPLYDAQNMERDLGAVSRNHLAERITGGLSLTTKMPCPSWGISAFRCRVGSVLAEKPGSTCAACYARRGRYLFPNVQGKLEERYEGLYHELWTPAMVFLIRWYCDRYFRWFDSGDLQGVHHLLNIDRVAQHTPAVRHWLPTREAAVVREARRTVRRFARNLVVRVSGAMIDGKPPTGFPHVSTVISDAADADPEALLCPSPEQGGLCGTCRACWSTDIRTVAYRLH
jgi:Gene product 88